MSERAPRGGGNGPAGPTKRKTPPLQSRRGRTGTTPANARARRRQPAIEIDRIVVMRIVLLLIVIGFLYLVVSIGIRAFGGGGVKQGKMIDRVILDATTPRPPAVSPGTDAGNPRKAPP